MQSAAPGQDTIAAIATAPGRGGIGILRLSGPLALDIAELTCGISLQPRHAHYCSFSDTTNTVLDNGIALHFPAPNSFTGEDVVELQGHGGPVVLDLLLKSLCERGARLAEPGEFSQRAYLNDKMDLAQAEAIADLIAGSTEQAVRNAARSLQGAFSQRVKALVEAVIALRVYVEAAIDFPEEEIDFLADGKVAAQLDLLIERLQGLWQEARQGSLVREGMRVVIAGKPNAGKSSLLNALAGQDRAIVTDIAGTTRDVLREDIQIDGMPLHIVDTAGLRQSEDAVEREGIRRAMEAMQDADHILLVTDDNEAEPPLDTLVGDWSFPRQLPLTVVRNKCDLSGNAAGLEQHGDTTFITLSAQQGDGMARLREHLRHSIGLTADQEGQFSARRRHLDALQRAEQSLLTGQAQLIEQGAGELLAEDLREAQEALGEITGDFSSDQLLGEIFSSFCIGK